VAVAGIATPEQFFAMVRDRGVRLGQTIAYADHHRYTQRDVAAIAAATRSCGASSVLTTAKDAVRFEVLEPLPFPLAVVPVQLEIDDWSALAASLDEVLTRKRNAA
jgi:tetraacyldisaccharide 4'-kinase